MYFFPHIRFIFSRGWICLTYNPRDLLFYLKLFYFIHVLLSCINKEEPEILEVYFIIVAMGIANYLLAYICS